MITYRLETQSAPEPPVKFYKLIAISFLVVTLALLGLVIFVTSKKAQINIVAKKDSKKITLNIKVEKIKQTDHSVAGNATTTQFFWSEKFYPTGNKTAEGLATGEVIIYNKSASAQPLVKTTRLLTPSGILFHLTNGIVAPANGQITAMVYADAIGRSYDISPSKFSIPGLKPNRQLQVYAESVKSMQGGLKKIGILSDDDLRGALASYKEKVKDAYLASVSGIINSAILVSVDANSLPIASNKVGEEVSEFTLSGNNKITAVFYNATELKDFVKKELNSQLDNTTEKFLTADQEPTVKILSNDGKNGSAELTAEQEVTVTLDPNASSLAPQNFFGKRKDEIERYVLGLNHVSSVEVVFSPMWMLSAPTSPDKIKIVVKNID